MRIWTFILQAAIGVSLASCAAPAPDQFLLGPQEESFGTLNNWRGYQQRELHAALNAPGAHGLRFPGYVVGVESLRQDLPSVLGPKVDPNTLAHPPAEGRPRVMNTLWRIEGDRTVHTITHVLADRPMAVQDSNSGWAALQQCALHSYVVPRADSNGRAATEPFVFCDDRVPSLIACEGVLRGAFSQSWEGLRQLRVALKDDLRQGWYTDLLVLVLGWNTPQAQAIDGFNAIVGSLLAQAADEGSDFRPLVVGLTWSSDWTIEEGSVLSNRAVRLISFFDKKEDAYEVGLTWAKAVVEDAVLGAREDAGVDVPLTVVSHSFGARMMHMALSGPQALRRPNCMTDALRPGEFGAADRVILLQGAFEVEDLWNGESLLRAYGMGKPRVTLTASAFDQAVTNVEPFQAYAGSWRGWEKICDGPSRDGQPSCGEAVKVDQVQYGRALCQPVEAMGRRADDQAAIRYLDASRLINCVSPAGGAHSDIYRREMAAFLLDEMSKRPKANTN